MCWWQAAHLLQCRIQLHSMRQLMCRGVQGSNCQHVPGPAGHPGNSWKPCAMLRDNDSLRMCIISCAGQSGLEAARTDLTCVSSGDSSNKAAMLHQPDYLKSMRHLMRFRPGRAAQGWKLPGRTRCCCQSSIGQLQAYRHAPPLRAPQSNATFAHIASCAHALFAHASMQGRSGVEAARTDAPGAAGHSKKRC